MKITRNNRGFTLYITDIEYTLLNRLLDMTDKEVLWNTMSSAERRSWKRRINGGEYFRVNKDRRTW